jgi:Protein of unknown function (DUF3147)
MIISVDLSGLRKTKWHEYAVRFVFGGLTTVGAGLIAHRFGPEVGGLFLAFPAIFPASATLVEKHERQKKKHAGLEGTRRGREASALDAVGAALGSIALIAFAAIVWGFLESNPPAIVLAGAATLWLGIAATSWGIRRAL